MGIIYRIDPNQRIVFTYIEGTVTDDDIAPYVDAVWRDLAGAVFDGLIDASAVKLVAITRRGIQRSANLTTRLNRTRARYRVAIVAPQDIVYGVGRMVEVYREGTLGAVQVFRTYEEALAWLRPAADVVQAVE
ncbi:MAG TPA: hypothetical protein VKE41_18105 [Roseiflexaceae bacterium]|nr:hypothetical protein [Roseiflexaceae bacterium]